VHPRSYSDAANLNPATWLDLSLPPNTCLPARLCEAVGFRYGEAGQAGVPSFVKYYLSIIQNHPDY